MCFTTVKDGGEGAQSKVVSYRTKCLSLYKLNYVADLHPAEGKRCSHILTIRVSAAVQGTDFKPLFSVQNRVEKARCFESGTKCQIFVCLAD